jgi:PAS domain S-box-containing protein
MSQDSPLRDISFQHISSGSTDFDEMNVSHSAEENQSLPELEKYLSLIATLKGYEEFLLDADGIIVSSNLEAVNITGYEEYEVIGKHLSMFYPAEELSKAAEDLNKASLLGSTVVMGMRLKKRGATFWAKMKIVFVSCEGSKVRFRVTLQDNTHRTLSKMRVQSIRDEFLTIFNNPFIGTFKFRSTDNKILMCNQKTLDITGQSNSANLPFDQLFSSSVQWNQFQQLLVEHKRVEGFQFIINDHRTTRKNWGLISARFFESQGFVGGVLMDISEQYHQMTELQRVNLELENFTYHASHDLRAPLTTIMGLANLGAKETTLEGSRNYFEMIQMRIQHLDTLLKDLVSISYNNKVDVASELFDFKKEIDVLIETLQGPSAHVRILKSVNQPQLFFTDATRLRTVLRNLFSNSLKYHNPEIANPYLIIRVKVEGTHASLKVQDNGIGIDQSHKAKIFDMFYRATTHSNGSGLGLYIAKSMIEKINGKISVESTLHKGTTFLLTIPNSSTTSNQLSTN